MINIQWTKFERKSIATFISGELPQVYKKEYEMVAELVLIKLFQKLRPICHLLIHLIFISVSYLFSHSNYSSTNLLIFNSLTGLSYLHSYSDVNK